MPWILMGSGTESLFEIAPYYKLFRVSTYDPAGLVIELVEADHEMVEYLLQLREHDALSADGLPSLANEGHQRCALGDLLFDHCQFREQELVV